MSKRNNQIKSSNENNDFHIPTNRRPNPLSSRGTRAAKGVYSTGTVDKLEESIKKNEDEDTFDLNDITSIAVDDDNDEPSDYNGRNFSNDNERKSLNKSSNVSSLTARKIDNYEKEKNTTKKRESPTFKDSDDDNDDEEVNIFQSKSSNVKKNESMKNTRNSKSLKSSKSDSNIRDSDILAISPELQNTNATTIRDLLFAYLAPIAAKKQPNVSYADVVPTYFDYLLTQFNDKGSVLTALLEAFQESINASPLIETRELSQSLGCTGRVYLMRNAYLMSVNGNARFEFDEKINVASMDKPLEFELKLVGDNANNEQIIIGAQNEIMASILVRNVIINCTVVLFNKKRTNFSTLWMKFTDGFSNVLTFNKILEAGEGSWQGKVLAKALFDGKVLIL